MSLLLNHNVLLKAGCLLGIVFALRHKVTPLTFRNPAFNQTGKQTGQNSTF